MKGLKVYLDIFTQVEVSLVKKEACKRKKLTTPTCNTAKNGHIIADDHTL